MGEIRDKISISLTRGADMREVFKTSLALAILSTLFNVPYFYYLIFSAPREWHFPKLINPVGLFLTETLLVFIVCLLAAMVGLSFSKRFELPGFWDKQSFVHSIPFLLVLGAVMAAISYLFFDRYFFQVSPFSYPSGLIYLILLPFKGAFTEEIILRLCLVTIGVGLLKSKIAGVILISILASFFTVKYFHFVDIEFGINYLTLTQFFLSFLSNLILGYLFVTRGLLYSMVLKYILGVRYILVTLLLR